MSQPVVNISEQDGTLGVLPSGARALAIAGAADSGPLNTPAAFSRIKDVQAMFGAGPLVEAAAEWIQKYERPVLACRTGNSVAGTRGTIDVTGVTGTSVATGTGTPNDSYQAYLKVVNGGTIGVSGITVIWSLDDGRTPSPITALGTATTFAFPGAGTLGLAFAAGTLVTGDVIRLPSVEPQWNTTELGTALSALRVVKIPWEICYVVGAIDATAFDALVTSFASMPEKLWIGNTRIPNVGESESAYKTALDAIFGSKASTVPGLCAGAIKCTSGVSFRQYRRPFAFAAATRVASLSAEQDAARLDFGPLPGVDIRDSRGNPDEHDESVNPGLDDSRFMVARTWDDEEGVYINNPRVFSPSGSDFQFLQHRRVMNIARATLRIYFQRRLSRDVQVDKDTGFILEAEALEIDRGATVALEQALRTKPKCSAVTFKLSRTDNLLLANAQMHGQARITPLAYPKDIELDLGFFNPALSVVSV